MGDYTTSNEDNGEFDASRFPAPQAGPLAVGSDFSSSNCGTYPGSAKASSSLAPGAGYLGINGNADLSSCIVGNSNACVTQIYLSMQRSTQAYGYIIFVYGQGPQGAGSGNLHLRFTDDSGSHYDLKLFSSTPKWHYVQFNSSSPSLNKVEWS